MPKSQSVSTYLAGTATKLNNRRKLSKQNSEDRSFEETFTSLEKVPADEERGKSDQLLSVGRFWRGKNYKVGQPQSGTFLWSSNLQTKASRK